MFMKVPLTYTRMGEVKNAYRTLTGKFEGKRQQSRQRSR
jgi:hypothetical protein